MAVSSGVFSTFSTHTLTPKAIVSANVCTFNPPSFLKKCQRFNRRNLKLFIVRASSDEADDDCNDEECAPEKEVGKVSMDWLAGEKTRVVGTYPPRTRGWTGYVEKDTAGQTNIYSVEPPVYVAESAISSGSAGSSATGSENTVAVNAGLALISVAAASSILLQVGKNNPPQVQTVEYSGPSLSYYINKFKVAAVVEVSMPSQTEPSVVLQAESSAPEVTQVEVQSEQQEPSALTAETVS